MDTENIMSDSTQPDHGVPPETADEESKGLPTSDREKSEKVPVRDAGDDT
jgi:hypothetical protein